MFKFKVDKVIQKRSFNTFTGENVVDIIDRVEQTSSGYLYYFKMDPF